MTLVMCLNYHAEARPGEYDGIHYYSKTHKHVDVLFEGHMQTLQIQIRHSAATVLICVLFTMMNELSRNQAMWIRVDMSKLPLCPKFHLKCHLSLSGKCYYENRGSYMSAHVLLN